MKSACVRVCVRENEREGLATIFILEESYFWKIMSTFKREGECVSVCVCVCVCVCERERERQISMSNPPHPRPAEPLTDIHARTYRGDFENAISFSFFLSFFLSFLFTLFIS